jgi:hypothetical protein
MRLPVIVDEQERDRRCARRLLAGYERAPGARQWTRSRHARKGIRAARRHTTATATERQSARRSGVLGARPGAARVDGFECRFVCGWLGQARPRTRIALLGCDEVDNPGLLCSPGRLGGLKRVMVSVCDRLEVRSSDGSCLRGTAQLRAYRRPHRLRLRDRRPAPSRRLTSSRAPIVDPISVVSLSDPRNRITWMASWIETGTSRVCGACGSQRPAADRKKVTGK